MIKKLISIAICFFSICMLYAQTSFEVYDKPLCDILNEVQNKYKISVIYPEELKGRIVTKALWKVKVADVEGTLTNILYPLNLRFKKKDENTYLIENYEYHEKPESEGATHLEALLNSCVDKSQWEVRKTLVRENILQQIGLSPFPEKNPLNPSHNNKRKYEGYTVENVSMEVLSGVYLCGSLYKPAKKGKYPAMLCPHGHFDSQTDVNERGRYRPDHQYRCAMLARLGAIAFSYDMFAWNEGELQASKRDHKAALA